MTVAQVWKEIEFDAGHRVPNHHSQCRHLHGHRYKVRLCVEGHIQEGDDPSSEGMVLDFGELKHILNAVKEEYDHKMVLWVEDSIGYTLMQEHTDVGVVPVSWIPTAENFAVDIYKEASFHATLSGMKVVEVQVYETPTSVAVYKGG